MNRRQVLALLGSAAVGGCVGNSPGGPDTTYHTTTTDKPSDSEGDAMVTDRPSDPPELGVSDPGGCPQFDSRVTRVVCSPEVGDSPLTFVPAEQSGSLPQARFEFSLTNGTDATFEVNFYNWSVWKRVEAEWYRVAPRFVNQPLMRLRAGDSHEWKLTVDNTDLNRPIPSASGTRDVTVIGLGPGTYAFGTDGWFEGQNYENKTGIAARFELAGEPLELMPVGIDEVERDGDIVVVRAEQEDEGDRAKFVATRVESAPEEPRRVITEQVIRETELRNVLAHFEPGVRRVRLEAGTTTYPAFGVNETQYVEYEGETYEIEAERLDAETTDTENSDAETTDA